ncbi:MAG: tyrosine-type recombinase/integrase [Proteobacteria bacterium]|nr:tyrosine-type recombinase/integrase [Pseudomonadota bacterium]
MHGSVGDAKAKQDELKGARADTPNKTKMKSLIESWLKHSQIGLRPGSVRAYVTHLKHIGRFFGHYYVDAITPADVEDFHTAQIAAGYEGRTLRARLKVLRSLSRYAREVMRITTHDFCATVRVRRPCREYTEDEPNSLTIEQLNEVLGAIPKRWFAHFATLAYTGARVGELLGLQWDDIDFAAGLIHIRRTNTNGSIGEPKTNEGRRTIAMVPKLAEILSNHRQALLAAQHPSLARGWVFAKRNGEHYRSQPLRYVLVNVLKQTTIPFRFTVHGFRRTYNDLLQHVARDRVVRKILGHTKPEMTAHYSTVRTSEKKEAAQRMFQLIHGGKEEPRDCTETGRSREDAVVCPHCNQEFPLNSNGLPGTPSTGL